MAAAVIDIDKLLDIDPYNGKPVIAGSRLRVFTLAVRHLEGRTPEEVADSYPSLSLPEVYAALAYFYEHRAAMEAEETAEAREALEWANANGAEIIEAP